MSAAKVLLDPEAIERTLVRIAHEVIERNPELGRTALVGIHTRGVPLAQRLRRLIAERSGIELPMGTLDITFYRDDVVVQTGGEAPLHSQPVVRDSGWETYTTRMDAQMRNAIYGYLAESDNQAKAAYMREVVMPGMARLLGRPAYDFTQPYAFNRSHFAFGCYHCHKVK